MNLNVKWTILSLFAAASLAVSGCTTDDNNGATVTNPPDDGTGGSCTTNQSVALGDPECQACLEANCCTELQQCFNNQPNVFCDDPYSDACVTCGDLAECEVSCNGNSDCIDGCEAADNKGIAVTAYNNILSCAGNNSDCAHYCNIQ